MKRAQRKRANNDVDVMEQVDVESAIVNSTSEQSSFRSHCNRAAASLNNYLEVQPRILIFEEQAVIQRAENRPCNNNHQEHRCGSERNARLQIEWAGGNKQHREREDTPSNQEGDRNLVYAPVVQQDVAHYKRSQRRTNDIRPIQIAE